MVLALKGGCFLCMWDSHADKQYYVQHKWLTRSSLEPGSHNVVSYTLVNSEKILLLPIKLLHTKLGLMKKFCESTRQRETSLHFLETEISTCEAKGYFDGPQIRKLLKEYKRVVNELLNNYQALS